MAKADSPTKTCGEDGCGRPLRARGLCATHYNRMHHPNSHRKVMVACTWCRRPCPKEPGRTERYANLFCSYACRDTWRRRDRLPVLYVGVVTRPPQVVRLGNPGQPHSTKRWVAGFCARCGVAFLAEDYTDTALYCSATCSKRVSKHRQRARKRSAFVANVSPRKIYERDGWRCRLCGLAVRRDKAVPHPLAPTIDHIVPLAAGIKAGGVHAPYNVQCAHFLCNSTKGARVANAHLPLSQ